jgi:hypothetical protein
MGVGSQGQVVAVGFAGSEGQDGFVELSRPERAGGHFPGFFLHG